MNWWSDIILACLVMTLMFYLTLAFIGKKSGWNAVISIIILTLQAFCFRDIFTLPSSIYVIVYGVIFTLCLFLIQRIKFVYSILGVLLTIITSIIGSLLVADPFLISIGIRIPHKPNGWPWVFYTFSELIIPILVFLILKISKISITRIMTDKES